MEYFLESPRYNCKTWKESLLEINKKHNHKYTYDKDIPLEAFVKTTEKIKVICLKHGEFYQVLNCHKQGHGCEKCGIIKRTANQTFELKDFIEKAQKIHGDEYDYSQVIYKNSLIKVKIYCKKCDEFTHQIPGNHFKYGCKKCGLKIGADKKKRTIDQFIKEARAIHGNKFDYSNSFYINCSEKINFKCNQCCKIISQVAGDHLAGRGCQTCMFKRGDKHPNWNPNLTKEDREKERTSVENTIFIKNVFKRDNWTCQITSQKGKIVVHHLDGYGWALEKRFDINNGITISQYIHKLFHKIYGNRNNTQQQFEEFVESLDILLCT